MPPCPRRASCPLASVEAAWTQKQFGGKRGAREEKRGTRTESLFSEMDGRFLRGPREIEQKNFPRPSHVDSRFFRDTERRGAFREREREKPAPLTFLLLLLLLHSQKQNNNKKLTNITTTNPKGASPTASPRGASGPGQGRPSGPCAPGSRSSSSRRRAPRPHPRRHQCRRRRRCTQRSPSSPNCARDWMPQTPPMRRPQPRSPSFARASTPSAPRSLRTSLARTLMCPPPSRPPPPPLPHPLPRPPLRPPLHLPQSPPRSRPPWRRCSRASLR